MKLSVVILNYNVKYFLELCLQSVQAALEGISSEIIVVDNNSCDDSCSMIKSNYPNVKLIKSNKNLGFSRGNNIVKEIVKGDFVCILNPDTMVEEKIFQKLFKFSREKKNLGIIGCCMINGSGKFLPESKRNVPTYCSALMKFFGYGKFYYASHIKQNSIDRVDILTGAFMFMPTKIFMSLDGFDEDFFMYGEDIDLCYRALKMNKINYYFGGAKIIHFKGESSSKNIHHYRQFYRAIKVFHRKHFKPSLLMRIIIKLFTFFMPFLNFFKKEKTILKKDLVFLNPHNTKYVKKNDRVINSLDKLDQKYPCNLVLDAKSESFAEIINKIHTYSSSSISFSIWPKNRSYCIGSNESNQKGQIFFFN